MCYSLWYNAPTILPAGGRQHRGCIIPQAVNTQSSAPEDGRDQGPKHVELIGIINKLLLSVIVASSWLSILFVSMMHGQANINFTVNVCCHFLHTRHIGTEIM